MFLNDDQIFLFFLFSVDRLFVDVFFVHGIDVENSVYVCVVLKKAKSEIYIFLEGRHIIFHIKRKRLSFN